MMGAPHSFIHSFSRLEYGGKGDNAGGRVDDEVHAILLSFCLFITLLLLFFVSGGVGARTASAPWFSSLLLPLLRLLIHWLEKWCFVSLFLLHYGLCVVCKIL